MEAAALYQEAGRLLQPFPSMPKMLCTEFFNATCELSMVYAAQCLYHMALSRSMGELNLCKQACEVFLLYKAVAKRFTDQQLTGDTPLGHEFSFYAAIFECRAHYHLAKHHAQEVAAGDLDKVGPQIARFTKASECLRQAMPHAKALQGVSKDFEAVLAHMRSLVEPAFQLIMRDNSQAYHARIPNVNDLEPLPRREGARVTPTPLGELNFMRTPTENIFAHLVSPQAEEGANKCRLALSQLYNDRVQEVSKNRAQLKDQVNASGATGIVASSVPMQRGGGNGNGLPDHLKQRIEAVQAQSGTPGSQPGPGFIERFLRGQTESINVLGLSVADMLQTLQRQMGTEAADDTQLRQMYGERFARWREPSHVAGQELNASLADLQNRVSRAQSADANVAKMVAEATVVRVLENPISQIDGELRTIASGLGGVASPGAEADLMGRMIRLLSDFDRSNPEEDAAVNNVNAFLEDLKGDSLAKLYLAAPPDQYPQIQEQQMAKLSDRLDEVTQVSNRSRAICAELVAAVEQLRTLRSSRTDAAAVAQKQYEEKVSDLERACNKSEEVAQYVRQGVTFWGAMSEALNQLKDQVEGWVVARSIQKEEILRELQDRDHRAMTRKEQDEASEALIRDMQARGEA
jgi:uncharacterized protein (DUF2267 family)